VSPNRPLSIQLEDHLFLVLIYVPDDDLVPWQPGRFHLCQERFQRCSRSSYFPLVGGYPLFRVAFDQPRLIRRKDAGCTAETRQLAIELLRVAKQFQGIGRLVAHLVPRVGSRLLIKHILAETRSPSETSVATRASCTKSVVRGLTQLPQPLPQSLHPRPRRRQPLLFLRHHLPRRLRAEPLIRQFRLDALHLRFRLAQLRR